MICVNGCGELYERDGTWWCLNNSCVESYFYDHWAYMHPRSSRQKKVAVWCADAFGAGHAASVPQRGIRLAEEAIEAAQAAGCDKEMLHRLVEHVYSRPVGEMGREIGGVGLTLMALASACGLDADREERIELLRVLAKPLEHFAARNKAKNDAGFNVVTTESAL